jgi:hypothetical protein
MCFQNTDPAPMEELIPPEMQSLRKLLAQLAQGQIGKATTPYTGPLVAQRDPMWNAGASGMMGLAGYGPYEAEKFVSGQKMAKDVSASAITAGGGNDPGKDQPIGPGDGKNAGGGTGGGTGGSVGTSYGSSGSYSPYAYGGSTPSLYAMAGSDYMPKTSSSGWDTTGVSPSSGGSYAPYYAYGSSGSGYQPPFPPDPSDPDPGLIVPPIYPDRCQMGSSDATAPVDPGDPGGGGGGGGGGYPGMYSPIYGNPYAFRPASNQGYTPQGYNWSPFQSLMQQMMGGYNPYQG